mgnify:CR=1 FL=1
MNIYALAPFTAGLSASLFGAGSIGAAGFAGFGASMAGTLGSNLYENKWRIDLAFRDSTKAKALRNAALDGLSSAMFIGVVKRAKIEGFKNLSGAQKVTRIAQHEAIKAGIATSMARGDLKSNLRRAAGNVVMQSVSLGVTEKLKDASGFQRTLVSTVAKGAVAGSIGRDVAATAIGTAVSSTMAEANVKIGSKLELQDFGSSASAVIVAATGRDVEQIADAVSESESVKFTRGLVKDDIREAIAREEKPNIVLGVAAGDPSIKTGSIEEEVREELEIERVVIHPKALVERGAGARKYKEDIAAVADKIKETYGQEVSLSNEEASKLHNAYLQVSTQNPTLDPQDKAKLVIERYEISKLHTGAVEPVYPEAVLAVGKVAGWVRGAISLARTEQATSAETQIVSREKFVDDVRKVIHGNSKSYVGNTHVYVIKDAKTGQLHKVGESMRGTNKFGLSKRAEEQARKLQKMTNQPFETELRRNFDTNLDARNYETNLIEKYRKMFGDKNGSNYC